MNIDKRALYNSLRMNWLIDPSLEVADWQVQNYRDMSTPLIFSKLREFGFDFNKESFCSIAEGYDTPEELTESLIDQEQIVPEIEDRIYLLAFELWRRLKTDKPCLSIFCDELDHQVFLYDQQQAQDVEAIQDILANLQVILDENTDQGADPVEVLHSVSKGCANDIETFLYDFVAEQVDNQNFSYATDLLDAFIDYVEDDNWFEFLRVRLLAESDPEAAKILGQQLVEEALAENNLHFNLELLSEMAQYSDEGLFKKLVLKTLELVEKEEDFQDLLAVCLNYYSCQDLENKEEQVLKIINKRSHIPVLHPFSNDDTDLKKLFSIVD